MICESQFECPGKIDIEVVLPSGLKFSCTSQIMDFENQKESETRNVYRLKFINLTDQQKNNAGEYILKVRAAQDMVLKKEIGDNEDSFWK